MGLKCCIDFFQDLLEYRFEKMSQNNDQDHNHLTISINKK